jgi:hypothetical protein
LIPLYQARGNSDHILGKLNLIMHIGNARLHVPYPDLAPSDFWLFGNLKRKLCSEEFELFEELREAVGCFLPEISIQTFMSILQN